MRQEEFTTPGFKRDFTHRRPDGRDCESGDWRRGFTL